MKAHEADVEVCNALNSILLADVVDLTQLRRISRQPEGFQTNELRKRIWPKLLQINKYEIADFRSFISPYRDDYQVWCDVTRLWGWVTAEPSTDDFQLNRHRYFISLGRLLMKA
ncbi:hypothetical protein EON64_12340 [archaeon]|nr:MAG: hypothetical protein EON64_12340 [archaeon]